MENKTVDVGPLEMKMLGVLNSGETLSVAEIQSRLKPLGHDLAYTTVMTVLVRLYKKNLLIRRKDGRQFLYSITKTKSSSPLQLFKKMKTSLFGTERLRPILGLLEADDGLSREELETLKRVINEKIKGK